MNNLKICPYCHSEVTEDPYYVSCASCSRRWPISNGIACFDSAKYFGEVSQERMQHLIALAQEGNWLDAAKQMFKESSHEMYQYIVDLNRASWIPLLPIGPDSTVLDVGCGLGALTHALSLSYERVVSIEPIAERAQFARIRCDQEGFKNVDVVQTTLDVLPFPEKSFDLIVLNGILEWVGEWQNEKNPRDAQLDVLTKLQKMLKPTGVLFIGIENRIGIDSFFGRIDHPGTRFTSLMPRWLASLYIRLKRPDFYRTIIHPSKGYRTYTYSPCGYRKLLKEAGFAHVDCWWPTGGYNLPNTILHSSNRQAVKSYCVREHNNSDRLHGYSWKRWLKRRLVVDTNLISHLFPDVLLFARPTSLSNSDSDATEGSLRASILHAISAHGAHSYVGGLAAHAYKNKSVLTIVSADGKVRAIAKVSNVHLPNGNRAQEEYDRQLFIYSIFNISALKGSIPKPLGIFKVGSLIASVEETARGSQLVEQTIRLNYFKSPRRVQRHLEIISRWIIDATKLFESVRADDVLATIPSVWCQDDDCVKGLINGKTTVQHGDFFPANIFIDEERSTISIIDWDDCGCGYPPLFDWFCLITGLYYRGEKVGRLLKTETYEALSFRQTYFESNWFSDLTLSLTKNLCNHFDLDSKLINKYFKAYLLLRRHQLMSRPDLRESNYMGPLYGKHLEYFVQHENRSIFLRL